MWLGPKPNGKCATKEDKAIKSMISRCTKYANSLSKFDQFLLWSYTVGSGGFNMSLIGLTMAVSTFNAVFKLFQDWPLTGSTGIPKNLQCPYWEDPESFMKLNKKKRTEFTNSFWIYLVGHYDKLISNAPPLLYPVVVYKVASPYGDLEEKSPGKYVFQQPLNSSSWDRKMPTFAGFLKDDNGRVKKCCVFEIHMPTGTPVLYLPGFLHAYPWENEILMPMGSIFKINSIGSGTLYDPHRIVQNKKGISLEKSDRFRIGPMNDLGNSEKKTTAHPVRYFVMEYIGPRERCVSNTLGNKTTADLIKTLTGRKIKVPANASKQSLCDKVKGTIIKF